jgi:hypothetical protein
MDETAYSNPKNDFIKYNKFLSFKCKKIIILYYLPYIVFRWIHTSKNILLKKQLFGVATGYVLHNRGVGVRVPVG